MTDESVYQNGRKSSYEDQVKRFENWLAKNNQNLQIQFEEANLTGKDWNEVKGFLNARKEKTEARSVILVTAKGIFKVDADTKEDAPYVLEVLSDPGSRSLLGVPVAAGAVVVSEGKAVMENLNHIAGKIFGYMPMRIDFAAAFKAAYEKVIAIGSSA